MSTRPEDSIGPEDENKTAANGDTSKDDDKSKGNGAAPGGFDRDEYDADILRVSGLPPEDQDVEFEKLVKKYGAHGVKRQTIARRLKEANGKRAKEAHARMEKERREREKKERDEKARWASVQGGPPPADYLKSVLDDPNAPPFELIHALNLEYAFTMEAGKDTVMRCVYEPTLERTIWVRMTPAAFKAAYQNRRVQVNIKANGDPVYKELGDYWLKNTGRRSHLKGVVFFPGDAKAAGINDEYLNLWTGFATMENRGDWRKLRRHIWKVICKRDKRAFKYLIRWMASVVQHPESRGYAAVVMRGEMGAGKGVV
jgi:hypothetical protein